MIETAHHRRKEPELNRQRILHAAAGLAARLGVQAVTLQKVSEVAGLTKGGLLHHFPSKEHLLQALSAMVIAEAEAEVEAHLAADPQPYGRFTRAYLRTCVSPQGITPETMAALWADPGLRRDWYDWLARQEKLHEQTDGAAALKIVRLAADGLWLAMTEGKPAEPWLSALEDRTREG